ncbi:hypothetical protein HETIRDRAFT_101801 [Heterobasidion irregulare TC 32-1]|uniref:Uncharacterized protein n=1 Tax=Heterobasidion irregulare (strain TC 32-1) TaxID=747525 RepID=W4K5P4_HETIT|nr:uncharacterized protein HETIRDRAFT_101801 [Heterobasidion irregulare TC 32-1]ETW80680.1 hypothetical protein HETIRDRAFT_101801 [Heterobasidion irregulare TC 32-1]
MHVRPITKRSREIRQRQRPKTRLISRAIGHSPHRQVQPSQPNQSTGSELSEPRCGIASGEAEAEALDGQKSTLGVSWDPEDTVWTAGIAGAVQKTDAQTERNHGRTKSGGVGVEPGSMTILTQRNPRDKMARIPAYAIVARGQKTTNRDTLAKYSSASERQRQQRDLPQAAIRPQRRDRYGEITDWEVDRPRVCSRKALERKTRDGASTRDMRGIHDGAALENWTPEHGRQKT